MAISEQVAEILRQDKLLTEEARQFAVTLSQREYIQNRAKNVLCKIYDYLEWRIAKYPGESEIFAVPLQHVEYVFGDSPETTAVRALIAEHSGLELANCTTDCVTVRLTSAAKLCEFMYNGYQRKLNFATLREKNVRPMVDMARPLAEMRPALAARMIRKIQDSLPCVERKHYGIAQCLELRGLDESFDCAGRLMYYSYLPQSQLNYLATEMNMRVAHGEVRLSTAADEFGKERLLVAIEKAPDKLVAEPIFDYKDFYGRYDGATLQLQEVYEHICHSLQFVPSGSQIQHLQPERRLEYGFIESTLVDWQALKYRVETLGLTADLFEYVERAFPGIKVQNLDFVRDGSWYWLIFRYEIIDEASECLAMQIQAERLIAKIKEAKLERIAGGLAQRILGGIDTGVQAEMFKHDYPWRKINPYSLLDFIEMDDGENAVHLSLEAVKDADFLAQVVQRVKELTDGLLVVTFGKDGAKYKLALPRA